MCPSGTMHITESVINQLYFIDPAARKSIHIRAVIEPVTCILHWSTGLFPPALIYIWIFCIDKWHLGPASYSLDIQQIYYFVLYYIRGMCSTWRERLYTIRPSAHRVHGLGYLLFFMLKLPTIGPKHILLATTADWTGDRMSYLDRVCVIGPRSVERCSYYKPLGFFDAICGS